MGCGGPPLRSKHRVRGQEWKSPPGILDRVDGLESVGKAMFQVFWFGQPSPLEDPVPDRVPAGGGDESASVVHQAARWGQIGGVFSQNPSPPDVATQNHVVAAPSVVCPTVAARLVEREDEKTEER